jgi:hypothetical protein
MSEARWTAIKVLAACARRALLMFVRGIEEFLKVE